MTTGTRSPTAQHHRYVADDVLDDVVVWSLADAHRRFARRSGRVVRYDPSVSAFIGHPSDIAESDWHDLARLVPSGTEFTLRNLSNRPGAGFQVVSEHLAVQMTGENLHTFVGPHIIRLDDTDVPDMLALVEHTRPGPFFERTIQMGTYVGIRVDGQLIAMGGERLRPPGWAEISAVCVHPDHRNRGYASLIVAAAGAHIREAGRTPFLHAAGDNVGAIRLYEQLGFRLRRRVPLTRLRAL